MKNSVRLILVLCAAAASLCMAGCSVSGRRPAATEAPNSNVTYIEGADFVGVVKAIDKDLGTVTLYNTSFEGTGDYTYSGATEITSKNNRAMVMDEVSVGEAYEIYTGDDGNKIQKMKELSDLVVAENAKVYVDSAQKRLTVQGVTYAYTDNLIAYSEGQYIDPMEITNGDRVTFRGVTGQAYSLVVTRGHGYIKPKKYNDFVGGKLIVHGEAILPVSKNMLLTVPEGTQEITMANGEFTGTATVQVKRGQVTTVDMSRFTELSPDVARVKFEIEPEGAELYVNGSLVDYHKPVTLRYGNHSVQVVLEGYNDYTGILTVREANPTVKINLSQETAEVESDEEESNTSVSSNDKDDDDSKETSGSSGGKNTTSGNSTSDADFDTDHTISVSAPKGAAVYVNGTYKGQIPCEFMKMLGGITLTLSMDGCVTKSYQIEIPDDSQDITWSFPDLAKKGVG